MSLPDHPRLRAELALVELIHDADQTHRLGVILSTPRLWQLGCAIAEVSRLRGQPWQLQDLTNGVATSGAEVAS